MPFFNFQFWIEIEMRKDILFRFNFHFKIEMEKDIFAHFNFYFNIETWKMIKIFQFSISNSYWEFES